MRICQRVVVVSAIAGLWPAMAGEARAQAGWGSSPQLVSAIHSNGVNMLAPKLGVDAAGNAVAVWIETGTSADGVVVRSARYDQSARTWGTPVTLSDGTAPIVDEPQIAVDGAGNAVATWTGFGGSVVSKAHAARYSTATGTWTAVVVPGGITGKALVAANAAGDAVIVWNELAGGGFAPPLSLQAMRYSAASATWSAVEPLAAALAAPPVAGDVAIDGAGNVIVVWLGQTSVQATRFAATANSWGSVVDLSTPLVNLAVSPPQVSMTAAGEALVSWSRVSAVEAARWPAGADAWEATVTVAAVAFADMTRSALDSAGNGLVVWTPNTGVSSRQLWAARYDAAAATWSSATSLSSGAFVVGFPSVTFDGQGNAFVAWTEQTPPSAGAPLRGARQATATGAWTLTGGLSAAAQNAFNPDIKADAAGNALVVWHQTTGAFAATQSLRWDATPPTPVVPDVSPGAGTLTVTFSLPPASDPALAATTLQYSLDGGTTWIARTPAGIASPLVIDGLTDGVTYGLRLRAVNIAGAGAPSATMPVRSGPNANPTDLRVVSRSGNVVTFAWVAPAGLVPDDYLIEGGLAGQTQVLASVPTGGVATQVTLAVPNGVFFVRVVAQRGTIRIGQSADLQVAVNAGGFPGAPANLLGSASGDRLALSWTNTWSGAALTGVRIEVSGTVITAIDLPPTERFTFDGVPPGTYTFVVTPLIRTVPGDASNVVTLTFPGTCATSPLPPTAFSASTQGGVAYLDWLPPASGPAATSYVVSVSGAFTGSFPMTMRTLAVRVGPGIYTVSVASVGLCGTSTATPAQTIVVP